jgi:UDP-N-acetylglucosamine 1-carboxyvinyltransferase
MDKFIIQGGRKLRGRIKINGSKNAALPILIATLLTDEKCVIDNVPRLRDIRSTLKLLEVLGKRVKVSAKRVTLETERKLKTHAPYDLVKQMRASILVAGPLLARFGRVRASRPGGCAIGMRPIDIHVDALEALGATSSTKDGDLVLTAKKLKPGTVKLRFASVGATENLMMAASALPGLTVIKNAAREPEIEDLADFLNGLGAQVRGAGSSTIRIRGAAQLHGTQHRVIPDRIETGTYALAVAAAGGNVLLEEAEASHLTAMLKAMRKAGIQVRAEKKGLRIVAKKRPKAVSVRTKPHPGFPTDLQAPFMTLMALAKGRSRIREDIFERRFIHAAELIRLGAQIAVDGSVAVVDGVELLDGAIIMASDIRAGAALVVAGVAARGTTEIQRVYHIDRGYERIENVLRGVGARIRRVNPVKKRTRRAK